MLYWTAGFILCTLHGNDYKRHCSIATRVNQATLPASRTSGSAVALRGPSGLDPPASHWNHTAQSPLARFMEHATAPFKQKGESRLETRECSAWEEHKQLTQVHIVL